jgi:hypothetical protein
MLRTPDPEVSPDRSALSLSRLYYGSGSRKTSRSTASDIGVSRGKEDRHEKRNSKDSGGTKEKRDPALLRKHASPTNGTFKSDQSILEQIGLPDHKGWMRKRGENYNTWKNRYFVLKGPHLYWLKSNNVSVRVALMMRVVFLTFLASPGDKNQGLCQHCGLSYGRRREH